MKLCSAHSPSFPSLHLRHSSFSNSSLAFSTSQLILQPFRCFTYVSLFSNPSFVSPTSQDFQLRHLASRPWKEPLWRASITCIYRIPRSRVNIIANQACGPGYDPRLGLYTGHIMVQLSMGCSFSKLSFASPKSQLILQPFPLFIYITAHSPTLPFLHLRHSSLSNPSFTFSTSQDFHLRHLASRPCS